MKNGLAGCLAHAGGAGSGVLEQKPSKERKEGKGRNEMKGENCVIYKKEICMQGEKDGGLWEKQLKREMGGRRKGRRCQGKLNYGMDPPMLRHHTHPMSQHSNCYKVKTSPQRLRPFPWIGHWRMNFLSLERPRHSVLGQTSLQFEFVGPPRKMEIYIQ